MEVFRPSSPTSYAEVAVEAGLWPALNPGYQRAADGRVRDTAVAVSPEGELRRDLPQGVSVAAPSRRRHPGTGS